MTFRQNLAAVLIAWLSFVQRRPVIALLAALLLAAACAGAMYLVLDRDPGFWSLSCFTGGCH